MFLYHHKVNERRFFHEPNKRKKGKENLVKHVFDGLVIKAGGEESAARL